MVCTSRRLLISKDNVGNPRIVDQKLFINLVESIPIQIIFEFALVYGQIYDKSYTAYI
jgi:hypothetical protein